MVIVLLIDLLVVLFFAAILFLPGLLRYFFSRKKESIDFKGLAESYRLQIEAAKIESAQYKKELDYITILFSEVEKNLMAARMENERVVSQRKSSEVRTGLIAEQMAPFLETFPYDPRQAHFLGRPLDFIVFTDDHIRFVEVKSGESKLTDVQRKIRKNIEEGRVSFEVFKIKGQ